MLQPSGDLTVCEGEIATLHCTVPFGSMEWVWFANTSRERIILNGEIQALNTTFEVSNVTLIVVNRVSSKLTFQYGVNNLYISTIYCNREISNVILKGKISVIILG